MALTTRRTKPADRWLRSSDVAVLLGYTRQHVTWLTRRDAKQKDPARGLKAAEHIQRGTKITYRYRLSDVIAYIEGPVYARGLSATAA
ncbi:hypothetical protein [Frankia sp. R82]|uniref:hypothetical protein n=1 Tax=Frankia sp. R82 TaxID=2950553 RepID=UPI002043AF52|nr:hypothetical protein [Frankia sp. R82]MCM3884183.1 hypothetical protein [Frankia sp. R82]